MRSRRQSRAAISTTSRTSSATSCCRWSTTPAWREEQTHSHFGDVVEAMTRKMIRRHPHVFGDENGVVTSGHVAGNWDHIKAEEKAERARATAAGGDVAQSLLSSVKAGLPALARALDLQRKASTVGFDWNDPRAVLNKIREEADEIEAALDGGDKAELARRPAT